jgi:signal transduction histidine kinase
VPADLAEYGRDFLQNKVDYYKVLIRFYFEDGTIKWITDSAVPVVSDGKVVASVGIMMDVTQMKKTEMELREMNAAKDKFFSIIAHDLRNPFNSLTGLSEFMIQNIDSLDKERITKFTKNIYQSSKDIFELITNLLQWSRIQTGRIQFDPVLGSLYILSESNVNLVQAQAMKKNVTIRNNIGPDLQVYGDKNMIDLILRNLLTNAIKYSHPGSEIRLEAERQADEACISVIDRGVGMSREKIDKLFKIEEQVSEVGTANESGTGLGLILVADFIAMHMGKIDVESEAGKGTTVSFTLPLSDERFR